MARSCLLALAFLANSAFANAGDFARVPTPRQITLTPPLIKAIDTHLDHLHSMIGDPQGMAQALIGQAGIGLAGAHAQDLNVQAAVLIHQALIDPVNLVHLAIGLQNAKPHPNPWMATELTRIYEALNTDPEGRAQMSQLLEALYSGSIPRQAAAQPAPAQTAWHQFKTGQKIGLNYLRRSFGTKYTMRRILAGGPIDIVEPYFAVARDPRLFAKAKQVRDAAIAAARAKYVEQGGEEYAANYNWTTTHDNGVPPKLSDPRTTRGLETVLAQIASGEIAHPLVFKRNTSGLGTGVVFIEPVAGDRVTITISRVQSLIDDAHWHSFLETHGFQSNKLAATASKTVPRTSSAPALRAVLEKMTAMDDVNYDSGMFERMIEAVRHEGLAYETRHYVTGELGTGEVQLAKSEPGADFVRWFARVGASRHFSNFTRRARAYELDEPDMYRPLFKLFGITGDRQAAFAKSVEQQITLQMEYLIKRYRDGGILLPISLSGAFDLMWRQPLIQGAFPRPFIVEADISASFSAENFPNKPPALVEIGPLGWK